MAEPLTITGVSAVRPDRERDVVHVDCSPDGPAGQPASAIDIHRGALATLVLSLLQANKAFSNEADDLLAQPMQLRSVGVVSLDSGAFELELVLEENLSVVIAVPDGALETLRDCLDRISNLRDALVMEAAHATRH